MVVGAFSSTCHVGTHVDAPLHLDPDAPGVDGIPLERLIGPAEVVRVAGQGPRVTRAELPEGWRPRAPRVLVATGSHPADATVIGDGFRGLEVELVHYLAGCGTVLVGIDTPSVDPMASEDLETHHALAAAGMTWIEGLLLDRAPAGLYQMVALPLPMVGADGAPVRAVLRPLRGGGGTPLADLQDEPHID